MNPLNIILVGAGNVATHLGQALQRAGHHILQVYSRTEASASELADLLSCNWTTELDKISADAQLYLFCVRDAVLEELARKVYTYLRNNASPGHNQNEGPGALFVHTAGSMSIDLFPSIRRGVFYPMQTFSKQRPVQFSEIPVFVQSNTDEAMLLSLASQLSDHTFILDEKRRRRLHLAAVFACNFANHMYDLSARILEDADIPFNVMLPLIDETARKVHQLSPSQAQTGPAARYDTNVMRHHLELLTDERDKDIYKLLSKSIHDRLRPDKD